MVKDFFDKRKITMICVSIVSALLLIFFDQFIKFFIDKNVEYLSEEISVIDNFFSIVHWHNTGGAWGIMSDYTWVLTIMTVIACTAVSYLIVCSEAVLANASFVLILSGAVGNVIDRIRLGYVIDYLNFYNLFGYNFPAFNLADICVVSGCIGLIICIIFVKTPLFDDRTKIGKIFNEKEEIKETNDTKDHLEGEAQIASEE
ncbi:MAG: signal peptidase II [Ruminococcaceae bacterium]|nr:signal peptidase II [Oscillospiraceae bacterium]